MRLLADENVESASVGWLREMGQDVLWAAEDLPSTPDPDVLSYANTTSRILLTRDRDFGQLVFAEQRAAPYSMKTPFHKRYTVDNNINATHNVLCAIVDSGLDIHLVHLGTMGVYGYGTAGMSIPEGYLEVKVGDEDDLKTLEILYPANPGSIYHMTKTQDALMFY